MRVHKYTHTFSYTHRNVYTSHTHTARPSESTLKTVFLLIKKKLKKEGKKKERKKKEEKVVKKIVDFSKFIKIWHKSNMRVVTLCESNSLRQFKSLC